MDKCKLKVKLIHPEGEVPHYAHETDSGLDLVSLTDLLIKPGERKNVRTGIAIELPNGYEAQVRSRSGLALRQGIIVLNSPGTIDEGYHGEIFVLLANLGSEDFCVEKGMRIAQLVISPVVRPEIIKFEGDFAISTRNDKGFGSSGLK